MLLADLRGEVVAQGATHLVQRLVDALLVPRLGGLEAKRECVGDASDTDLLAAVDVEQPQLVEHRPGAHPRDPQELADRGRFVDDDRQVAVDRLSGGNRSRSRPVEGEVEEPLDVNGCGDRTPGQAPRLHDPRMDLAQRTVDAAIAVDDLPRASRVAMWMIAALLGAV